MDGVHFVLRDNATFIPFPDDIAKKGYRPDNADSWAEGEYAISVPYDDQSTFILQFTFCNRRDPSLAETRSQWTIN